MSQATDAAFVGLCILFFIASSALSRSAADQAALELLDAIRKLGLRLEVQKRPQPVWVIDHIGQKPTEN